MLNNQEIKIIKDLGCIYPNKLSKNKRRHFLCECTKCYSEFTVSSSNLKRKKTGMCKECSSTINGKSNAGNKLNISISEILSKKFLDECFIYNSSTGVVTWKIRPAYHFSRKATATFVNNNFAGEVAGHIQNMSKNSKTKYIVVSISGYAVNLHRVIWIIINGNIPHKYEIDHIDRNGLNNKLENLRCVEPTINQKNRNILSSNSSNVNGVNWHKAAKKWQARAVDLSGKRIDLGRYDDFDEAVEARKEAELKWGYLNV